MWTNAGRAIRALRHRRGWTQDALGTRAKVSRDLVSRAERGALRGMTVGRIERVAAALGASVSLTLRWNGEQLDRLMDARHAAIQEATASAMEAHGWHVRAEVSFNEYGDRGRIDVLGYHPDLRALLVVEVKSGIGDLQETLGRLDVKARLARHVARQLGWPDVAAVIPALVIGDSRRSRRIVAEHAALFSRFSVRGRIALGWVRRPMLPGPAGLLWFAERSDPLKVVTTVDRRPRKRSDSRQV